MQIVTTNAYINPKTDKKQKEKRKRAVKNEIIHIDDITANPGANYINWIKITKEKLLERESKLMSLRTNILQEVISKQIDQFKAINDRMKIYIDSKLYENVINNELTSNCLEQLNKNLLLPWNGVVLRNAKNKFDTYRKYFTTSRSWYDQRKRSWLAQYLWIPIFDNLKEFIKIAAKRYFNERFIEFQAQFVRSLMLQVITNIFKQKVKLPCTRPHSLVSCSILKECRTFQLYITANIDESILINRLLQKNPDMSAVTLMDMVIGKLEITANTSLKSFQKDVYQLYDEFNFIPVYVEPLADYSVNIHNLNRNSQINNNNNNNDNVSEISSITNDLFGSETNTVMDYNPSYYGPYHSPLYSVTNERFSPLM